MGAGCIAICGNIQFYGKCGFELAKDRGIRYADDPNAPYFLLKELVPGFLDGHAELTEIRTVILSAKTMSKNLTAFFLTRRKRFCLVSFD